MARMGMDVDLVEDAGRQLQEGARSLEGILSSIERTVGALTTSWDGPDASRFVNDWWPEHKSKLTAVSLSIAGLGQSALNNASEQREVSGGASGGVSSATPSGGTASSGDSSGGATTGGASAGTPAMGSTGQSGSTSVGALSPGVGVDGYIAAAGTGPDADGYDPYGKAWGNCTSWAAFRRTELGLSAPYGHGSEMAGNVGGTTQTTPSLGGLVSYGSGANGHVMVIEEVLSTDPKSFRVSEMNIGGKEGSQRSDNVWTQQADGTWSSTLGGSQNSLVIAA